eukprot:5867713-Karenia_brevis.AAC.1
MGKGGQGKGWGSEVHLDQYWGAPQQQYGTFGYGGYGSSYGKGGGGKPYGKRYTQPYTPRAPGQND